MFWLPTDQLTDNQLADSSTRR